MTLEYSTFAVVADNITVERSRPLATSLSSFWEIFSKKSTQEEYLVTDLSFSLPDGKGIFIEGDRDVILALRRILSQKSLPMTGELHVKGRLVDLMKGGSNIDLTSSVRQNIHNFHSEHQLLDVHLPLKEFFEAVVKTSGLDRFLETRVERLSTGMRIRLSIALNLESRPDVICIGKIPAVLDAEFDGVIVERLTDLRSQGTTLIFFEASIDADLVDCILDLRPATGARPIWTAHSYKQKLADEGALVSVTCIYAEGNVDRKKFKTNDFYSNDIRILGIEIAVPSFSQNCIPYVEISQLGEKSEIIVDEREWCTDHKSLSVNIPVRAFDAGNYIIVLGFQEVATRSHIPLAEAKISVRRRNETTFVSRSAVSWEFRANG